MIDVGMEFKARKSCISRQFNGSIINAFFAFVIYKFTGHSRNQGVGEFSKVDKGGINFSVKIGFYHSP